MGKRVQKSLLDFIEPEPTPIPLERSGALWDLYEPREGEMILLLGYNEKAPLEEWRRIGAELLIFCDREREAARARKAGYRAVLVQSEYLGDRERFDGIVQCDPDYRFHDLSRGLPRLVRSLRPGGRLFLEIPLTGHLAMTEERLESVLAVEGMGESVEKIRYPEAEEVRRILADLDLELEECREVFRHRWIDPARAEALILRRMEIRAIRVEEGVWRETLPRILESLRECCLEPEGALVEEEVILRVAGVRPAA